VLSPFPEDILRKALAGVETIILVEENADGQLAMLCARHGLLPQYHIRRFDGRPFTVEDLSTRVREVRT